MKSETSLPHDLRITAPTRRAKKLYGDKQSRRSGKVRAPQSEKVIAERTKAASLATNPPEGQKLNAMGPEDAHPSAALALQFASVLFAKTRYAASLVIEVRKEGKNLRIAHRQLVTRKLVSRVTLPI
jgi:hypothetical protein